MDCANRNLDGVYFRINRNDEWHSICFSDLTDQEMDVVLEDKSADYLKRMCKVLGHTIREIGNEFDIVKY